MSRIWWILILLLTIVTDVSLSKKHGGKSKGWPKSSSGSYGKNYGASGPYQPKYKVKSKYGGAGRIAAGAAAGAVGGAVLGYGLGRLSNSYERQYYRQQHYTTYRAFIMKCYNETGVPFNVAQFNATLLNSTVSENTTVTTSNTEVKYTQHKEICETKYWEMERRNSRGGPQHSRFEYEYDYYDSAGVYLYPLSTVICLSSILVLIT